jgi:hypothetical protein
VVATEEAEAVAEAEAVVEMRLFFGFVFRVTESESRRG